MIINRTAAKEVFLAYTDKFDTTDTKIWLKVEHSLRVAEVAEEIAQRKNRTNEETDAAWFMGLLHDFGRFEQLKRYGTFVDKDSVDHAELGADILFVDGYINKFEESQSAVLDPKEKQMTEIAIRAHNKLYVPEGLDERTFFFTQLLRDADKTDIFRVLAEIPYEKRSNPKPVPAERTAAREEVMKCVAEHRCVPRTALSNRSEFEALISQCCMAFELVFSESKEIVKRQGYLKRLLEKDYGKEQGAGSDLAREQMTFLREEIRKSMETGSEFCRTKSGASDS